MSPFLQEQLNPLLHLLVDGKPSGTNLCEGTTADAILVPLQFLQEKLNYLIHLLVDGKPSGTTHHK
jgi:hypothetical protein